METIGLEPITDDGRSSWEIEAEGPETLALREKYRHIPDDEFNRTLRSATRILSRCPNPLSTREKITGLAIGKVQSGKTLSFTTLIALAAANRYSKIVVIAGRTNTLLEQTVQRLKKDLGGMDPRRASKIFVCCNPTTRDVEGVRNAILSNKCALLVVLKHKIHIGDVAHLLASPEMPHGPALIIDDEGDEASLNSYFRRGQQSPIYESIMRLRNTLPLHAYVAYTATPQANLLLEAINDLSPDFCELIEPGSNYCGGSVFFGERSDKLVREIKDISEDLITIRSIPESLKDALAVFFVGAAMRHIRAEGQRHSMLIHMTHRKDEHRRMTEEVKSLLRIWADRLFLNKNDPSRQELMERFKRAYDDLSATVPTPPTWNMIEDRLSRELQSYEPHMVNSLPEGIQIAETTFQLENNIVIGGNILSRGVTLQDLTVSYMARRARQATNVDTMEQRARWFGYKAEYIDLCRIYLPRIIINDFQRILRHEDDFWDSLQRNLRQGIPIKNWPRFFRLDSGSDLKLTRASVARSREFRPRGWDTQRKPIRRIDAVDSNIAIIDNFFRKHNSADEIIGSTTHKFIRDCSVMDVVKELLLKLDLEGCNWDATYYSEYLRRLVVDNKLQKMDVVLMNRGTWRMRSLVEGGNINNLMVGRNENYPGDANIHQERVQLQVHYVKCNDGSSNDMKTTALAIFIPHISQLDMSYIVRGDAQ